MEKQYTILDVHGLVIGQAIAANPRAAVSAWNRRNPTSPDTAVEAYCPHEEESDIEEEE